MAMLLLCILSVTANAHQPKQPSASKGVQGRSKGPNLSKNPVLTTAPASKSKGGHSSRQSKKRRGSGAQPVPQKKPRRGDTSKDRSPSPGPVKHPKPSKSKGSHGGSSSREGHLKPSPVIIPTPAPAESYPKPGPHDDNTTPIPPQDRDHDSSTPESHVNPPSRTHLAPLPSSSPQPGSITIENPPSQAQPSPSVSGDNSGGHSLQPEPNDIDPPPFTELVPDSGFNHHTPDPYPYPFPDPNTPKPRNPKQPIPPTTVEDENSQAVLRRLAGNLDRGLPEGWEALFQTPETRGSTGLEVIHPSDLNTTIQTWSLDGQLHQNVLQDLDTLIDNAIGNGVYVARGLSYTSPTCRERFRPLCLSTLIVATRVQYAEGHKAWRAEIAHVYMHSTAERSMPKQDTMPSRNRTLNVAGVVGIKDLLDRGRKLTRKERQDAESMLSTSQSDWALDHLPEFNTLSITHHRASSAQSAFIRDTGSLENLLGLFTGNTRGDRDAFNSQKLALLKTIQDATQTRDQTLNNKQIIVKEDKVAESLENSHLLSDCFKRAGIQGSVQEWWDRIYPDIRGSPISIECESAVQRVDSTASNGSTESHTERCSNGQDLTAVTRYAWAMIVPHGSSSLNVMLLENTVNTTFVDCDERRKSSEDNDSNGKEPIENSLGAVVRWSVVQPNGSFHPVQYLAHWTLIPELVHKEILSLLRFYTASAFMNVLMPAFSMPQEPLLPLDPPETIHNNGDDENGQNGPQLK
ncbi:hypothetical protein BGZ70_007825 [Mortierella alpina]|uniref:Uncharacterized protein n=1 Tax=Mortierella alpina TaxID=64518 RepID=A0A9P6M2B5_MORAP|nr:hypothetical protein BGZ70_007825 [Mortierella alpina]